MYDIGVALRRFKPLIRWTAWKASQSRSLRMSFEDVEAEGFLALVECCREFPEGQTRFARYFKRSWYNRLKTLYRNQNYQKRQGIEVDIENAVSLPVKRDDFLERMQSRYQEICPLLSNDAKRLLETLLDPPQEVIEYAYRDFCRKNKLHSQGQRVTGHQSFRVRLRHIRGILGMSSGRMREVVTEVKHITQLRRSVDEEVERQP
jgi:hypothetical protein